MLSVLVHYLDANDAGPGFYKLAAHLGLIEPRASSRAKLIQILNTPQFSSSCKSSDLAIIIIRK